MIDDENRLPTVTDATPDAWDSPEAQAARIAQARALREQAAKGGLRFEAYLPPDLAEWLLGLIERGIFVESANPADQGDRQPRRQRFRYTLRARDGATLRADGRGNRPSV